MKETKKLVRLFLQTAGYSNAVIDLGVEYANSIGWDSADDLGQLVLSYILCDDQQLQNGTLVAWEPVDWENIKELRQ